MNMFLAVEKIKSGLTEISESWFAALGASFGKKPSLLRRIKHALTGLDKIVSAYQLYLVLQIMESRSYLKKREVNDFTGKIFEAVCGSNKEAVLKLFFEYYDKKKQPHETAELFAVDVSDNLKVNFDSVDESLLLLEAALRRDVQLMVAEVFDDKEFCRLANTHEKTFLEEPLFDDGTSDIKCPNCKSALSNDDVFEVDGKEYCSLCFKCSGCGKTLNEKNKIFKSGDYIYCANCDKLKKCSGCGKALKAKQVYYSGNAIVCRKCSGY